MNEDAPIEKVAEWRNNISNMLVSMSERLDALETGPLHSKAAERAVEHAAIHVANMVQMLAGQVVIMVGQEVADRLRDKSPIELPVADTQTKPPQVA